MSSEVAPVAPAELRIPPERVVCHSNAAAHPHFEAPRGHSDRMEILSLRNSEPVAIFKNRPAWVAPTRAHWADTAAKSNYGLCLGIAVATVLGCASVIIKINNRNNRTPLVFPTNTPPHTHLPNHADTGN
eukprot:COSAG01_NODE_2233_length_8112_cov_41.569699_6_plen_130_part_00